MKTVFPIMMILAIGFTTSSRAILSLWYIADNESFTETFCVNKNRPGMACNGRCHIMAATENERGSDSELPAGMENEPRQQLQQLPPERHSILQLFDPEQHLIFSSVESIVDSHWVGAVFRPPSVG